MAESFSIVVSLPHPKLSPNIRAHWAVISRHRKAQRNEAHVAVLERGLPKSAPWAKATTYTSFNFAKNPPGGKSRDEDNYAAMLKGVWDGLQDAGLIVNDSGLTHQPPKMNVDPEHPECVIICVERKE